MTLYRLSSLTTGLHIIDWIELSIYAQIQFWMRRISRIDTFGWFWIVGLMCLLQLEASCYRLMHLLQFLFIYFFCLVACFYLYVFQLLYRISFGDPHIKIGCNHICPEHSNLWQWMLLWWFSLSYLPYYHRFNLGNGLPNWISHLNLLQYFLWWKH